MDRPPDDGWWQAKDGNWYSPESRPSEFPDDPRVFPPPPLAVVVAKKRRFIIKAIVAFAVLALIAILGTLLVAWAAWSTLS